MNYRKVVLPFLIFSLVAGTAEGAYRNRKEYMHAERVITEIRKEVGEVLRMPGRYDDFLPGKNIPAKQRREEFVKLKRVIKKKLPHDFFENVVECVNVNREGDITVCGIGEIFERYGERKINTLKNSILSYRGKNKILKFLADNFNNALKSVNFDIDIERKDIHLKFGRLKMEVPKIKYGCAEVGLYPEYNPAENELHIPARIGLGSVGINLYDLSDLSKPISVSGKFKPSEKLELAFNAKNSKRGFDFRIKASYRF